MTTLHYEISGTGETIILGHAGFVDSRMWDTQWKAFTEHYRVLRYDMQGYGKSDVATQPMNRRKELLQLMNDLNIEKVHLVGASLSGAEYLDFTLMYPEKVTSLTMVNAVPNGFQMQAEPPRYLLEMMAAMQAGDVEQASELQLRIWIDGSYREPDEVDSMVRQKAAQMNIIPVRNNTFFIADSQPVDSLSPLAIERLEEITSPVLVVDSTLDDPVVGQAAELMQEQIPNVTRNTISDAAHLPNMEKPDEFNQIVLAFLACVDSQSKDGLVGIQDNCPHSAKMLI